MAGKPIVPTAAKVTRAPPMNMGCIGAAPFFLRERKTWEQGRATRGVLPCPHLERISSPIEPRGFDLGRSSSFFRYRSHSSFVDGRDARLVMVRSPSERDQRSPRQPPLRERRLHLWRRSKGACSEDSPRGESVGLVQTRSCPRSTEQTVARLADQASGPSCTWSKRHSQP